MCIFAIEMFELNLPPYDVRLRGTQEKPEIFDFLRKRYVALTPEEWVRQHFTHWLVDFKSYPKGLLGNEVELRISEKKLRCDSILYHQDTTPHMIIEYKAPSIKIKQQVFDQISVYNLLLHVDYLVVSNGLLAMAYCTIAARWTMPTNVMSSCRTFLTIPSFNPLSVQEHQYPLS